MKINKLTIAKDIHWNTIYKTYIKLLGGIMFNFFIRCVLKSNTVAKIVINSPTEKSKEYKNEQSKKLIYE